jgi:hypothetical protein
MLKSNYLMVCTCAMPVTVAEHVLSSLAWKPGSWVRIPHKAWIFGVCMRLFCVCVVRCLGTGLATSWSPVQGVIPSVKWSRNWEISPMLQKWEQRGGGTCAIQCAVNSCFKTVTRDTQFTRRNKLRQILCSKFTLWTIRKTNIIISYIVCQ